MFDFRQSRATKPVLHRSETDLTCEAALETLLSELQAGSRQMFETGNESQRHDPLRTMQKEHLLEALESAVQGSNGFPQDLAKLDKCWILMCLNDVGNHKLERNVRPQPNEHNFQVSRMDTSQTLSGIHTGSPMLPMLPQKLRRTIFFFDDRFETKIDTYTTCFSLSLSLIFRYHYTIVKLRKSKGHL